MNQILVWELEEYRFIELTSRFIVVFPIPIHFDVYLVEALSIEYLNKINQLDVRAPT